MKTNNRNLFIVLALLAIISTFNSQLSTCFAQGTAFTYQGRLNNNGTPANGLYDFRFKLYFDPLGNTQAGSSVVTNAIPAANGLFTVAIDFGPGIFNGSNYWLEVDVKTDNAGSYTVLNPLQPITPTPYAVFANTASNVSGTISSANISGTYGNAVTLNNSANSFAGSFTGNGANVTNVNAVTLNGYGAGNFWQLGGNNVAGGQVLGSTNNQSLAILVAGQRALLITTNPADSANFVGGSPANTVDAGVEGAVIAGGGTTNFLGTVSSNHISANFASIGGGSANWIQSGSDHSFIGGGWNNLISPGTYESAIAGGENNINGGTWSMIGGGLGNTNLSTVAFIGSGYQNQIQPNANGSVIAGGYGNTIQPGASEAFIGSGNANVIQSGASESAIGGGGGNIIQTNSNNSVIGGGVYNTIQQNDYEATIAGGWTNVIQSGDAQSTIGGGLGNVIQPGTPYSTISGGIDNQIQSGAVYSTISGGYINVVGTNAQVAAIAGGWANNASGNESFVGGGDFNTNGGWASATLGGEHNLIQNVADHSTIAGGFANSIIGSQVLNVYDFIGGGYGNAIQTNIQYSVISGGTNNIIGGGAASAAIPGGANNIANGNYSLAAGQQAQALHQGAFVWADSQNAPFPSTANDQFLIRAQGGVGINMNNPGGASLYVRGDRTNGWPNSMSWFENTDSGTNASPALRAVVDGGAPAGALSVSVQGGGLIAQFGNGVAFVSQLDVNGNWTANSFTGNGSGLTALGATNLTGTISLAQLPGTVLTNYESGPVTFSNTLTLGVPTIYLADGSVLLSWRASGFNFIAAPSGGTYTPGLPSFNTAVGYNALPLNAANWNTAVGASALAVNTNGPGNTAIGSAAMNSNTNGSFNTAVGDDALLNNQAGSYNIALGDTAGMNLRGSNNIAIGNQGFSSDQNTTRIGTPGTQTSAFIAGTIYGDGGGLTNLNISTAELTGEPNNNIFVGPAGNSTTLGFDDIAIGINAFIGNTTGIHDTAVGFGALEENTTGADNTAIGNGTLFFNTNGVQNTANGSLALDFNTSGSGNTAGGYRALEQNTNGSFNVASGAGALVGLKNGSNNIALGYFTGNNFAGDESGNIVIGNGGTLGDQNIIRIGSGQTQTYIAGVINGNGSGLTSLTSANLTGALPAISGANLTALNASQLTSGTVPLTQLPAGVLTNNETTAVTLNGVFLHSDGANNFFAGPSSGGNVTGPGVNNTAIGYATLFNNQGGVGNTALGSEAFENNHTGNENTALGYQTLFASQQGHYNLAIGYQAGNALTTGSSNIYVGNQGVATEYNTIRIGTPGIHTNAVIAGVVTAAGGLQVGTGGTAMTFMLSGQTNMPSSLTQETNFTIVFPTAFSTVPKVIFTIANASNFQGVSDVFASSVASNTTTNFSINVYRLNGTSWGQSLLINWNAWQ